VAACWTRAHMGMESNFGQVKFFFVSCSRHVVLHYTKNDNAKVVYFSNISYHTSLHDLIVSGANVDPTS
jgi:hypothetical protein